MCELTAPDINKDINIVNADDYVNKVDSSLILTDEVVNVLDELISLEIACYLMSRIGGKRPFDQTHSDTLRVLHENKTTEFF